MCGSHEPAMWRRLWAARLKQWNSKSESGRGEMETLQEAAIQTWGRHDGRAGAVNLSKTTARCQLNEAEKPAARDRLGGGVNDWTLSTHWSANEAAKPATRDPDYGVKVNEIGDWR
jgi:hypothetical protein